MRSTNIPLLVNADMAINQQTRPIQLDQIFGAAVQASWSGAPVGELTVQVSDDDGVKGPIINWSGLSGTAADPVGTPDNYAWNLDSVNHRWARLVYVAVTGSGILNVRATIKGI